MIINNARFEQTAVRPQQYPVSDMPEIAFLGRSNVGKSSIINALLNRKSLARVGATPGKTREINFYNIDDTLYFVDLPGYGYANVSKEKKATWGDIIETYLNTRQQLGLLIMLVDIRHKPSSDDKTMYQWILSRNTPHMIVATKLDKITRSQIKPRLKDIKAELGANDDVPIIPFSAETKAGRDDIWKHMNIVLAAGDEA